jgi:hypothetical protein
VVYYQKDSTCGQVANKTGRTILSGRGSRTVKANAFPAAYSAAGFHFLHERSQTASSQSGCKTSNSIRPTRGFMLEKAACFSASYLAHNSRFSSHTSFARKSGMRMQ